MAVLAVCLFGWGRLVARLARAEVAAVPAMVLGLAAVVFVGGVLNLVRLAYAPSLAVVVLAGLAAAARDWRALVPVDRPRFFAVAAPTAAILAFTVATQLPPSAYNVADDYAKYFFHPVRMLASGTLYGSAMSAMGSETLGGKAFLDAFVAALFPLRWLNATDAVLGLGLCLALAGSLARNVWAAVACVLIVFFIDPQYMNISALYLGAALVMAAIALSRDDNPMGLGLLYAALIALKPTFALFVALHLVFLALMRLRLAAKAAGFALLFVSPWILLHAPHYWVALTDPANVLQTYGYGPPDMVSPLSIRRLTYGSAVIQYTLTMLAAFFAGLAVFREKRFVTAAAAAGLASYLVMFFVFGPRLSGHGEAVRYFAPMAIGIVPAVMALTARGRRIAFAIVPLVVFSVSLVPRLTTAVREHFILAFPFAQSQAYRTLDRQVTSNAMAERIRKMQAMVPKGARLVAWINAPFDLDLARNRIVDMDSAGLATPWAAFPDTGYVIWEYGGVAMPMVEGSMQTSIVVGEHERIIAGQELKFTAELKRFAQEGALIFDDGRFAVIRMPGTSG
jgi:hypothetical protein